ncbi:MAG: type II toxin-antitoxin system HicA family toxin [Patescibacteria group bacterium]|nr:type II toxin-antitoxin system HicA family toxin [Patescibacteria group bacterium]
MAPKLPSLTAKDLTKIIRKCGFSFYRQKGSHQVWKHPDGRWTTIPFHSGENIGKGLLRQILRDFKISPEDFTKLLRKQ